MNPKVFCDRMPLCDLQDSSICASLTIFHSRNWHYDLHAASSELFAFGQKLFRLCRLTQSRGDAKFRKESGRHLRRATDGHGFTRMVWMLREAIRVIRGYFSA